MKSVLKRVSMQLFAVILICLLELACAAQQKIGLNFRYDRKTIELPITVEVFHPQGLAVSTPDIKGLQVFSFHGKIRSPRLTYEKYSQSLAQDIERSTNGRWVFENSGIRLQPGDVLHFWIFIQFNGAGQRFNNLVYKVDHLIPTSSSDVTSYRSPTPTPSRRPVTVHRVPASDTQPTFTDARPTTDNRDFSNKGSTNRGSANRGSANRGPESCECNENTLKDIWAQMNATAGKLRTFEDTIPTLEDKIKSLTETLDGLIDNQDFGTQLLLTGNLPLHTNAVEDVRHLLIETLKLQDLSTKILQASYKSNGILFEMSSPVDKLRILRRSKDILSVLKLEITDPQKAIIDVRSE